MKLLALFCVFLGACIDPPAPAPFVDMESGDQTMTDTSPDLVFDSTADLVLDFNENVRPFESVETFLTPHSEAEWSASVEGTQNAFATFTSLFSEDISTNQNGVIGLHARFASDANERIVVERSDPSGTFSSSVDVVRVSPNFAAVQTGTFQIESGQMVSERNSLGR